MHSCLSCQRQPDGSSMAAEISQKICLNWEIIKCHCSSFWIFELVMPLSILLPFPVFDKVEEIMEFLHKNQACEIYVSIYLSDSVILIEKLSLILIRNRVKDTLTQFLPSLGRISPYMSITWQQPVGIGLTIGTSKIEWTSIQKVMRVPQGSQSKQVQISFSCPTNLMILSSPLAHEVH